MKYGCYCARLDYFRKIPSPFFTTLPVTFKLSGRKFYLNISLKINCFGCKNIEINLEQTEKKIRKKETSDFQI